MERIRQLCAAAACIVFLVQPAFAVVIYKKGSSKPVAGHLVRQNGNEVVVREETATGNRDLIVPRSEIEDLIKRFPPKGSRRSTPAGHRSIGSMRRSWQKKNSIPRPASWRFGC